MLFLGADHRATGLGSAAAISNIDGSPWQKLPGADRGPLRLCAADDITITGLVHQEPEAVLVGDRRDARRLADRLRRGDARKRMLENIDWVAIGQGHAAVSQPARDLGASSASPSRIWQRGGSHYVIDRTGSAMSALDPGAALASLPLVTGEGAQSAVAELVNQLEAASAI